jgi:hypothetical protein
VGAGWYVEAKRSRASGRQSLIATRLSAGDVDYSIRDNGIMTSTVAALFGALFGATLTSVVSLYIDHRRRMEAQSASLAQALRSEIAVALGQFYRFPHAISWITWYATYNADSVDRDTLADYKKSAHEVIPALQGALAVVASLSIDTYDDLQGFVHRLFVLDKRVSLALVEMPSNRNAAIAALREIFADVNDLQDQLPHLVHRSMAASRTT